MGHSYTSSLHHVVFSTKERRPFIVPELRDRLWSYMGGIARENGMKALGIGGTADHVHLLMSIPSTLAISKAVQLLKGGSSKMVHETFPSQRTFAWQEGYGAFSIGISGLQDTLRYIQNQEEHHRRLSFEDEFKEFLRRHGIEFDERYVLG